MHEKPYKELLLSGLSCRFVPHSRPMYLSLISIGHQSQPRPFFPLLDCSPYFLFFSQHSLSLALALALSIFCVLPLSWSFDPLTLSFFSLSCPLVLGFWLSVSIVRTLILTPLLALSPSFSYPILHLFAFSVAQSYAHHSSIFFCFLDPCLPQVHTHSCSLPLLPFLVLAVSNLRSLYVSLAQFLSFTLSLYLSVSFYLLARVRALCLSLLHFISAHTMVCICIWDKTGQQ